MAVTVEDLRQITNDDVRSQTTPNSISQIKVAEVFDIVADLLDKIESQVTLMSVFPNWIQGTFYPNGARVTRNSSFFESQVPSNNSDPLIDTIKWKPLGDVTIKSITAQLGLNGTVGSFKTGDILPIRTPLQTIMEKLLVKTIAPTYTNPQVTLTSSQNNVGLEVGDTINVPLNGVFIQNDGGGLASTEITRNGIPIGTSLVGYEDTLELNGSVVNYRLSTTYQAGTCKTNNLGTVDCTGSILAGTVYSNIINYQAFRNVFWGFTSIPTTSTEVRVMSRQLVKNKGEVVKITVPAGSIRVVFAVREDFTPIQSIEYLEMGGVDIQKAFVTNTISVEGSNNKFPINYKVYIYTPVEPYSQPVTYLITI